VLALVYWILLPQERTSNGAWLPDIILLLAGRFSLLNVVPIVYLIDTPGAMQVEVANSQTKPYDFL